MEQPCIDQKLKQLYQALGAMQVSEDIPNLMLKTEQLPHTVACPGGGFKHFWDIRGATTSAKAQNRASQLVANIACLKDHYHKWCTNNKKKQTGDRLIGLNRDVAIVHDLWNWDKHGGYDRASRSGLCPILRDVRSCIHLAAKPGQNESGKVVLSFSGLAQFEEGASLKIVAEVIDKEGRAYLGCSAIFVIVRLRRGRRNLEKQA